LSTLKFKLFPPFSRLFAVALCAATAGCTSEEANAWSENTYVLDIASENWYEPRGIGGDIDDFVPRFLLHADSGAPEDFGVTVAPGKETGEQDLCSATRVLRATSSPPSSTLGPSEYSLFIQHVSEPVSVVGTVYDLTMKNVLPDGDRISEVGEFSATMDFRDLYPLFTLIVNPTPEAVCTTLEDSYGVPCTACPNDGGPYCLTVKANGLGATPTSTALAPVGDVTDPACTPTAAP
jgi:hypothetical protein